MNASIDPAPKVIYDFGSNNGDDIPYYLLKADRVVAVEANPVLCEHIRRRFPEAIAEGRLVVENCVLDVGRSADRVAFYIHKGNHVLSQFPRPDAALIGQFREVQLPSRNVIELVREHGDPYYAKIDIEHYDQVILRALFDAGIRPPYLSAESHHIEVFCLLVALGGYQSFKLVDGKSVPTRYKDHRIATRDGGQVYSFPLHSAGPFGNDIAGDWMTPNHFARVLMFAGLGWRDIHVSRIDPANPAHAPQPKYQIQLRIDY